jgi:hypothetical protein
MSWYEAVHQSRWDVCGGKRWERSDTKIFWNETRGKQDDQSNINSFGKLAPLSKAIYIALVILLPPRFIPKDLGI